MSKKLMTLALALMMVVAVFAGCAQKAAEPAAEETVVEETAEEVTEEVAEETTEEVAEEETAEETAEETTEEEAVEEETEEPLYNIDMSTSQELELSCWDIDSAFGEGVEIDKLGQYLMDKFNITITTRNVTWGDLDEKNNLWAAANDMPATVTSYVVGGATYYQWCEEGVVRAIPDEILSNFPILYKNTQLPEVTAYAVDGQNFLLPRMTYADAREWYMARGVYYRKDWAAALGYETLATEDDFVNMCIDFATKDPDGNGQADTTGITATGAGDGWVFWSGLFTNYGICDGRYYYIDGKLERTGYTSENSWDIASMLRKINKGGAFDPDYMTRSNSDECMDVFANGKAGVLCIQISPEQVNTIYQKWILDQPDVDFYSAVDYLPLEWETGYDSYGYLEKAYWSETYFGSKVTDEELPRYLALYDWLCSDEGLYLMNYGFEGEDYEFDADGNVVNLLGTKEDGTDMTVIDKYPNATCQCLADWYGDLAYINPTIPAEIRKMAAEERDYRFANYVDYQVDWALQAVTTDETAECTAANSSQFMLMILDTSDKSDEDWRAEIEATWEALGLNAAIESVDAAYNG